MDKQLESNLNFIETVAGMVAIATDLGTGVLAFANYITPQDTYEVCVQMNEETWHRYFGEKATHAEDRTYGTALWARHNGRWYMCIAYDKEAEV